jgi:hypothetical protein
MDYYQGVVVEYLRATRTRFVNTECLIQLVDGDVPDKGLHWYCDAVVVDLHVDAQNFTPSVYLCEISYSKTMGALLSRLAAWDKHWRDIKAALVHDCAVDRVWPVRPWVFIPEARRGLIEKRFPVEPSDPEAMPSPRITSLEEIAPWKYRSWNGKSYTAVDKSALRNE